MTTRYEDIARTFAMFNGTALMEPRKVRDAIAYSLAALFADNSSCPTCFDYTCSVHDKPAEDFNRDTFLAQCGLKEKE